ncbi:tail fiber assembly protein [Salinicola sp. RZ23]|uniref:tail fiber assembly protein n=1 Tax=Salinicola sp. RZ23 TaxID=1949087 RepID=UPI0018E5804E|nr:tail fiber assembly protein [Salinicola sp. RZ23]
MIDKIEYNGRTYLRISAVEATEMGIPKSVVQAASKRQQWTDIRTRRDALLRACDYAVMPDYPLTDDQLAEVKAYRQALRDIPETAGDPDAVEWPAKPEVLA